MLEVMVVDGQEDRRADVVDVLCEIPGVEVVATASDAAHALALIDRKRVDAVIAASDLAGASIVALIDGVRRHGLADVIVVVTNRIVLPGMREYWRDLGARGVVNTLGELVGHMRVLADPLSRERKRPTQRLDKVVFTSGSSAMVTSEPDVGVALHTRASRAACVVAIDHVLHAVLPRLARLVHEEIQLVLEVGSDLPLARCTVADLERIALYLVHDAARALPLGGKVWLFVEREGPRHVRIEVLDSSSTSRAPGPELDTARTIAESFGGELRVVDLGNATSLQVVLPAKVEPAN